MSCINDFIIVIPKQGLAFCLAFFWYVAYNWYLCYICSFMPTTHSLLSLFFIDAFFHWTMSSTFFSYVYFLFGVWEQLFSDGCTVVLRWMCEPRPKVMGQYTQMGHRFYLVTSESMPFIIIQNHTSNNNMTSVPSWVCQ